MKPTRISDKGINLLKELEGFSDQAYQDTGGVWTVGYGTTRINNIKVKSTTIATEKEATSYLYKDIKAVELALDDAIAAPITQNQFDALVCFVYNVGITAFMKSTLLRKIEEKRFADAAKEFDRWVYVGGFISEGLKNRRKKERSLFETK